MDIWRYLKLVRAHSLLFFMISVGAFVLIMVAPLLTAQKLIVYKSAAKVLITPSSTRVAVAGQVTADETVRHWFADDQTLRTLLGSQDLLDEVLRAAHSSLSWLELRERIQLDILSQTGAQVSLVDLGVLGTNPEETRVLATTLAEKFIDYVQQLSAKEQDRTVAFLERERRNCEREVARAQKALLKIGVVPRESGQDPLDQAWVELQQRRNELERDLAMAEAEAEQFSAISTETGSLTDLPNSTGSDLMSDAVAKERLKLAELREVFTEKSPQVQAQLAKIKRMEDVYQRELSDRVASRQRSSLARTSKIRSLLAETQARIDAIEKKRPGADKYLEYANQNRQLSMWQENYLDLTRQLYRARVLQQGSRREGAFTIVEKPQAGKLVSGKVGGTSSLTRAALAVPLALLCGLAGIMGLDYLSSSMRLVPRIEEALGLPIIGQIPNQSLDLTARWDTMKGELKRGKAPPPASSG